MHLTTTAQSSQRIFVSNGWKNDQQIMAAVHESYPNCETPVFSWSENLALAIHRCNIIFILFFVKSELN
jgi:hypothetical protein